MPALTRPNILFINTDQQRHDTLGCYGSPVAKTPHLDRLAADGVRFTHCYTTNPVCMPARASYVTGQYPSHHGVWMNGVPLSRRAETLQGALGRGGYHTGLIGKIHLDNVWLRGEPHPEYDFQVLHECEGDPYCKDEYFHWLDAQGLYEPYLKQFKREGHRNGYVRDLPEAKHMNNWIAGLCEEYVQQRAADGRPFFLSAGFFDPHHPFDPVEPYASLFTPEEMPMPRYREGEEARMTPPARGMYDAIHAYCQDPGPRGIRATIAAYHATIAHVDAMVGRLLAALEETGLADNTVVIFTSDHGEMLGDHGLLWKGPLFYEGAVRVPLIYRFPARCGVTGVQGGFVS
ncbi:MAG TPA: sulfatase-like hydrolase/transferase, partial [Armatimonadota bacterium]|nr:sulfatase-like hydrolase/transferase [Armatimonadota bacterium]